MEKISVKASGNYDIIIEDGILVKTGELVAPLVKGRRAVIVTDDIVDGLYSERVTTSLKTAGFEVDKFVIANGEASKNAENYVNLLEFCAEKRLSRKDVLIALGGGVVGDLTGFAAATFLRGIAFVQLPTTLLAAVDSSVGGKTAIDLKAGKNLAGAFYQPKIVLCDCTTFDTLPEETFADGMAEVIKYGMINTPDLLLKLQGEYDINEIIEICVTAKRDIVAVDERDTGIRQFLNFGHTPAHGIEILSEFTVSHGSAVAIGMVIMTKAAIQKGLCEKEALHTLLSLLEKFSLPAKTVFSAKEISDIALSDKKRAGDEITLVLPEKSGKCVLKKIPVTELSSFISEGI